MTRTDLLWRPTDPEGRRWELWSTAPLPGAPAGKRPHYLGRVLVHHRDKVSLGYFTTTSRGSLASRSPTLSGWSERFAASLPLAAKSLVTETAALQKKKPRRRSRG